MYTIITAILSLLLLFGEIHPATDHPITFQNEDTIQMAFVAVSDTHVCNTPYSEAFTALVFEDVANAGLHFDAYVNCGDLADNGASDEYDRLFSVLKKQSVIANPIVALGNHDVRFAFSSNSSRFRREVENLLGISTNGRNYYAYEINGYTFIVLGTEKQLQFQAHISDEQLRFLDTTLEKATKDGKPAFVLCHQPLKGTHGTDAFWSVGNQSEQIRNILCKYKNVFFLSGHIHDGFKANSLEQIADSVWCVNLPTYGKVQDIIALTNIRQSGIGYYAQVYDDEVIFTGRDFGKGNAVGITYRCELSRIEVVQEESEMIEFAA